MKWQGRPQSNNITDIRNSNQFELFLHDAGSELSLIGQDLVDAITGPFSQKEYIVFPTNHRSSYVPNPAVEAQLSAWRAENNIPTPRGAQTDPNDYLSRGFPNQMTRPRNPK